MNPEIARQLQRMQDELARLRALTPVVIGSASTVLSPITIIGGQSLGTYNAITSYGIGRYSSGILPAVTTQTYDPGTVHPTSGAQTGAPSPAINAWPTALGYGNRWTGVQYERVIVVNDSRCPIPTSLIGGASDDTTYAPSTRQMTVMSSRMGAVSLLDGSTISAWIPDF